jgi:SAM-dependent methyltransferase
MTTDTIYDHPLYYDILFGWDRDAEAEFYAGVLTAAGVKPRDRVLEVACGTGQIARRLASRGFSLTGLDLSEPMLAFLREAAAREGPPVETLAGDMVSFKASEPFAAAFNPMSSFRLLPESGAAIAHLRRVAEALRPGGVYVLDLEFAETGDGESITTDESWDMQRGPVTVRAGNESISVEDGDSRLELSWGSEMHLLAYAVDEFEARVAESGAFTIASWHPEGPPEDDGISRFQIAPGERPRAGRSMVTLARS